MGHNSRLILLVLLKEKVIAICKSLADIPGNNMVYFKIYCKIIFLWPKNNKNLLCVMKIRNQPIRKRGITKR